DYPLSSRVERGQLQCVLIGFSAAVAKKECVVGIAALFPKFLCKLCLQAVDDGVGVEADSGNLLLDRFYIERVAVSDGYDGMSTVEIEVFHSLPVPDMATFCPDRL